MFQRVALLAVAAASLSPLACDSTPQRGVPPPPTDATLEGTITYGGQKVPMALVIAQGPNTAATAVADETGHYTMSNVPLGEVNIAVNTAAGKGMMRGRVMARSMTKSKEPLPAVIDVPTKYANPATCGIKTTIKSGPNTFDIVIPK
jgi:hypothetical protein